MYERFPTPATFTMLQTKEQLQLFGISVTVLFGTGRNVEVNFGDFGGNYNDCG